MGEIRGPHGAFFEDYFLKEYDAIKSCRQTQMLRSNYRAVLLCMIFKDRNFHNINRVRKAAIIDSLSSITRIFITNTILIISTNKGGPSM